MKLIVAHVPSEALDALRTRLLAIGVRRITISEVHSSGPQAGTTLRYRGATMRRHTRAELRLECVAADDESQAIVAVLHGCAVQIAVIGLEELHAPDGIDEAFAQLLDAAV